MRALGLRQRLEPVRDFLELLVPGRLRHAGIHVGVLVRLTRNCRLEVLARAADREIGRRIAHYGEVVQVAVGMAGLAFGRRAEQRRDVVLAFDVGLVREIQVAAVRLRLAGERGLEVVVGFRAFEVIHGGLLVEPLDVKRGKRAGDRASSIGG